jgi:hypothetical protein
MEAIAGDAVVGRNGGDGRYDGPMSIQSLLNPEVVPVGSKRGRKKVRARQGIIIVIAGNVCS